MKSTTTLSAYQIKWAVIAPFNHKKGFNRNYVSALKNAGFTETIGGLFVRHFNSQSEASVSRVKTSIVNLKQKIEGYKNPKAIFSFIITDKQFGLIATEKANVLAAKKGWVGLPLNDDCTKLVPVTYNQMYAHGAIVLKGSQANHPNGITFDGKTFKRQY